MSNFHRYPPLALEFHNHNLLIALFSIMFFLKKMTPLKHIFLFKSCDVIAEENSFVIVNRTSNYLIALKNISGTKLTCVIIF